MQCGKESSDSNLKEGERLQKGGEERIAHLKALLAQGAYKVPTNQIAERLSFALLETDILSPPRSEGE